MTYTLPVRRTEIWFTAGDRWWGLWTATPVLLVEFVTKYWKNIGSCVIDWFSEAEVELVPGSGFVQVSTFRFMLNDGMCGTSTFFKRPVHLRLEDVFLEEKNQDYSCVLSIYQAFLIFFNKCNFCINEAKWIFWLQLRPQSIHRWTVNGCRQHTSNTWGNCILLSGRTILKTIRIQLAWSFITQHPVTK